MEIGSYSSQPATFVESNLTMLEIISTLLPSEAEWAADKSTFDKSLSIVQKEFMFQGDSDALNTLAMANVKRGLCNATFRTTDLVYKCRTCQLNKECGICQNCFLKGNHTNHDFYIISNCDGTCDCGDVIGWKRQGFCSEHLGSDQILPFDNKYAVSVERSLDALFTFWRNKLLAGFNAYVVGLTEAIVEMLLILCGTNESLLIVIAKTIVYTETLLKLLVRAERFLTQFVAEELHDLLLKLLMEPSFKNKFAAEFVTYYPEVIKDAINYENNRFLEVCPLVSKFSLHVFTSLDLIVNEKKILETLFECLKDVFGVFATDASYFYDVTARVLSDTKIFVSLPTIPWFIVRNEYLLSRWFWSLSLVQGMSMLKNEHGVCVTNPDLYVPFSINHLVSTISTCLVAGAFESEVPQSVKSLTENCLSAIERVIRVEGPYHLRLTQWPDITFDANSSPTSIHFPLHHFLSMLLRKVLRDGTIPLDVGVSRNLLQNYHPSGFSACIMEHPLRARVFYAQFRCGMWIDNTNPKYSFEKYHVGYWSEGLESDLFLLQFCAAFAPADRYIRRIVGCFGLSDYLSLNLQMSSQHEPDLVGEMLTLLIQILHERRFCGFSTAQSLRRELIYRLSIRDYPRSVLMESLPRDLSNDRLDEILNSVAVYCSSSSSIEILIPPAIATTTAFGSTDSSSESESSEYLYLLKQLAPYLSLLKMLLVQAHYQPLLAYTTASVPDSQ
ncbi:hypothetical protein ACFE04_020719 [Oxalis oulophora]